MQAERPEKITRQSDKDVNKLTQSAALNDMSCNDVDSEATPTSASASNLTTSSFDGVQALVGK